MKDTFPAAPTAVPLMMRMVSQTSPHTYRLWWTADNKVIGEIELFVATPNAASAIATDFANFCATLRGATPIVPAPGSALAGLPTFGRG